jgi:hypothetical protein
MRRPYLALAVAVVAAVAAAGPARASDEPVTLTVSTPGVVASNIGFPVRVAVSSDPGALDAATAPLRVRVRVATECGGSFDSTPGPVLLDKPLAPGGKVSGTGITHTFGTFTACAFLEQQGDDRLFAFDDSTSFAVTHPCTTFTRRVIATKRSLRKVRKALRHAHGVHRASLGRRAAHLRAKLRRANAGRRRNC